MNFNLNPTFISSLDLTISSFFSSSLLVVNFNGSGLVVKYKIKEQTWGSECSCQQQEGYDPN